jgi:DNA invertase Pin-like site-specific DNA recombinase
MIFGYMRISTNKDTQKTDRQLDTLKKYADVNKFAFDEIAEEKISGNVKGDNRLIYKDLKSKFRKNDILVLTDLDRLGRNADDTITELKELKVLGVKVIILDIPYMNEWEKTQDNSMYEMIIDILITLKSHIAQQEREKIQQRIKQGLEASDKKPGRPGAELPKKFIKEYERYLNGNYKGMTATAFANMLGIGRSTFYKYVRLYESSKGVQ